MALRLASVVVLISLSNNHCPRPQTRSAMCSRLGISVVFFDIIPTRSLRRSFAPKNDGSYSFLTGHRPFSQNGLSSQQWAVNHVSPRRHEYGSFKATKASDVVC
jgi:hypothetical protein